MEKTIFTLEEIKERIKSVKEKYNIESIYIFGSYARGEATETSDIDLYCSPGNVKGLIERVGMIQNFETVLDKKVDLVIIGSQMNDAFKTEIEKDMIKIF